MGNIQSIPNHTVDPTTGFIESLGYANAFDAERKKTFLQVYFENGLRIRRACDSMGLSVDTIHRHYKLDPVFKEQFDAVEAQYLEDLEGVSRINALNPKSVIERIFQLKCLLPIKYGQENKPSSHQINVNIDGKFLENMKKRDEIIEAEVITSTLTAETKSVDNQHDHL